MTDTEYIMDQLKKLIQIDSPTGFTYAVAEYAKSEFEKLGYKTEITSKGGVLADIGGQDNENSLLLSAHIDTLGGMVREIKGNGRLKIKNIGGLNASNTETESVTVYTRSGKKYGGTFQLCNASSHVNSDVSSAVRNWDNMEIVLDEDVSCAADIRELGIENGCYVCFDPRFTVTESGYIKSRFLDDKLSAAILLGFARYLSENKITPQRHIFIHFTVYEELGHGAAGICPANVKEILGIDMGCVGDGLTCTEKQVSICAADSSGPYNYETVCRLVEIAKKNGIDYAVDIYPFYGSDCSAAVKCYDLKHALIGSGIYASHGYERAHISGLENTFALIKAYICQ